MRWKCARRHICLSKLSVRHLINNSLHNFIARIKIEYILGGFMRVWSGIFKNIGIQSFSESGYITTGKGDAVIL